MRLEQVRRWARGRGIAAARFRRVHQEALLHVASRMLQAIHRESGVTRLSEDGRSLEIGRLKLPASGPLPFGGLEVLKLPRGFLGLLRRALRGTEYTRVFPRLRSDFENSVANVTLNRLLGPRARAIEPAYQGHQYYPFPALRIGPSLKQVLACSHLNRAPVDLPLLESGPLRFVSVDYESHAEFFRAWSGLEAGPHALLPVHPWQLRLSPLVRALARSVSRQGIEVIPLASQRTCRVVRTGFDLKLPVDATITGEQRLLYGLNCANAPLVSALAEHVRRESGARTLEFQTDVASIFHAEPHAAPHLSAIVRGPVHARAGEELVPAINLWAGRMEIRRFLRGASATRVEEFFAAYCRALMKGPVEFCAHWGMAFEPHVQNVYVALRRGMPVRIVLRDLDNSILDPRRVRPLLRRLGAALAHNTWQHMPSYEDGSKRMVQAMMFGHLGEVMRFLQRDYRINAHNLAAIVEDTWSALAAAAPSAAARRTVRELHGWSDSIKATLRTRLHRAHALQFVRE
jgi:siderophore synthetase component